MVESHDHAMPSSPSATSILGLSSVEIITSNNEPPKLGAERHGRLECSALPTHSPAIVRERERERVCVCVCACVRACVRVCVNT